MSHGYLDSHDRSLAIRIDFHAAAQLQDPFAHTPERNAERSKSFHLTPLFWRLPLPWSATSTRPKHWLRNCLLTPPFSGGHRHRGIEPFDRRRHTCQPSCALGDREINPAVRLYERIGFRNRRGRNEEQVESVVLQMYRACVRCSEAVREFQGLSSQCSRIKEGICAKLPEPRHAPEYAASYDPRAGH
jgi:hypothetical protein